MGVTGLWRLIEPAGKPVPVETLENKVLAVDISIWLHQMVKGYQDAKGAPLPNAHLMGLFQRLCKLLYFRIKPVFVFDGAFPDLKKETIAKRQDSKSKYNSQSEKLKREIALLLGKKTAITALLGTQISPKKNKQVEDKDDIFKLPALPEKDEESDSESDDDQNSSASSVDLHSVNLDSDKFKNMPLKDKYDLLVELKETRKMNSWGKIHTLPKKSDNFSDFQMQRLLQRRKVQECLEETEKEMGDSGMSLTELESILNEDGIDTKFDSLPGRRIASNNTTRYLLISNVKQALADAKKKEMEGLKQSDVQPGMSSDQEKEPSNQNELEDDLQKAIKMSLECVDESEMSACASKTDESWTSCLTDSDYSNDDDDDDSEFQQPDMTSAKAYIMQYSDFTYKTIDHIVGSNQKGKNKCKNKSESKIGTIIDELNQEKAIIDDEIELTSAEEGSYESTGTIDNKKVLHNIPNDNNESSNMIEIERKELITENQHENQSTDLNDSQSVLFVENSHNEIVSLETSMEEINETNSKELTNSNLKLDSESSDNDFEEVSDNEERVTQSPLQLTLHMGKAVEDDIFADVFENDNLNKIADTTNSPVIEEKLDSRELLNYDENKQDSITPTDGLPTKINVINDLSKKSKIDERSYETSNKHPDIQIPGKIDSNVPSIEMNDKANKEVMSLEKMNSIVSEIENQEADLLQEKGRLDRIGRNITEQITKEAQELLQLFGIPYIVAPMEAEAQCAFLENIKLTDGTITDDSDIWLFGGKTVYKNFFNHKKHVLQFLSERIEKSFNLSREQLVLLSLLVGSDYTTGVAGVGPVTALEILASFPYNKKKFSSENSKPTQYQELVDGLKDFKKWVKAGKRTDNVSLKKKLKNVNLSDDFPSVRVVQAYMEPNVEKSEETFTWGELDITILRDYTKAKFGWSQNKLDEIIKPVLKRMLDRKNQKTVHDYFKRKIEFQSLDDQLSKRVKAAVQKLDTHGTVPETQVEPGIEKGKRKRKIKGSNSKVGSQNSKQAKTVDETTVIDQVVKSTAINESEKAFNINITKNKRYQEIIPQREKDKQHLLENKLKAIELFRKTKIDRKRKPSKRKLPVTKEKAELSESESD